MNTNAHESGRVSVALRFEFATAGRILFGRGRAAELPEIVRSFGPRVFVIAGHGPDRLGAAAEPLLTVAPDPEGWGVVRGEPTFDLCRRTVEAARAVGPDVVVAIGGGSAIDLGKAVAMLLGNGGDPLDYAEGIGSGKPVTRPSVPFAAVPVTAGTGAEVTRNAVLGSTEHGVKVSLRSPTMLPSVALVDPELGAGVSPSITASSGMDALVQLIEAYASSKAQPLTDALCRVGLERGWPALPVAVRDGADLDAREAMAFAALCSGLALANAGLGAVHGFAGPLGGMLGAPHGVLCATLLAPVLRTNLRALRERSADHPALSRYADLAAWISGRPQPEALADAVDARMAELRSLPGVRLPGLGALGLAPDRFDEAVAKSRTASSMKGNPIALTEEDLHRILAEASPGAQGAGR